MISSRERKIAKVRPIKRVRVNASAQKIIAVENAGNSGAGLVTERLTAMLEDGLAQRIAEVIRDASLGEVQLKPHQLQIIDMILDRTEGKPTQAHTLEANQVDEHTARLLAELLERRLAAEGEGEVRSGQ
jgi:hypothetical protein